MAAREDTDNEVRWQLIDVRELFCGECGYGIVIRRDPPECPMCRAHDWRERAGFAHWN